jgi:Flp pilus assembly protein TadD
VSAPVMAGPQTILTAADASRGESRFAEAMLIYQEVLVADSKSVAAQYGIAECLLGLGKASDARSMFDALTKNPDYSSRGLQGAGLADLAQNRPEQATKSLRQATATDPTLWRAWNGIGLLADAKHDPQEAATAYGHAIAINSGSAVLHNNLGYSRLLAGKPDEAIVEFRKSMDLDPGNETTRNNYRIALATKGDYAGALRGVVNERLPEVLNNVGYVAMQRGDLASAEKYLALAMEQNPSFDVVASQNVERLKTMKAGDK